jgi:hypothetical protein
LRNALFANSSLSLMLQWGGVYGAIQFDVWESHTTEVLAGGHSLLVAWVFACHSKYTLLACGAGIANRWLCKGSYTTNFVRDRLGNTESQC